MKKLIISFVLTLFAVLAAGAQDRIVRTDNTSVEARVTEITPTEVCYKRFSNPDGPTYILPVDQVNYILYPNGEKDLFQQAPGPAATAGEGAAVPPAANTVPAAVLTPAAVPATAGAAVPPAANTVPAAVLTPAAVPATAGAAVPPAANTSADAAASAGAPLVATPPAAVVVPAGYVVAPERMYAIGDFYDDGVLKGVVCALSDDKMHGLLLSVEEANLAWTTTPKPQLRMTGADNMDDGSANMQAMEQYIAKNNLSWSDFPAFEWCRSRGEGWYLPSINELLRICANYNGGLRTVTSRDARNRFNDALREHGGSKMDRLAYYFSSTEYDAKKAYCSHVDMQPPFTGEIAKNTRFLVRAVHKF